MAVPGTPSNFLVQSANQEILVSWDQTTGATSYTVQRSEDNVTYSVLVTVSGSPLATSYLDTTVILGTQYWYTVYASNASGDGLEASAASAVPTPTGEMCLSQIRLQAQQRADRVNSQFITQDEWRRYINQAMFELYDLLITVYEDLYVATPVQFTTDGSTYLYPLPTGSNSFTSGVDTSITFTPRPFYKLLGVDLAIQNTSNGYVSLKPFNFADRNNYIYPNSSSTIYGVFNMRYRLLGLNQIEFIPTPSASQAVRIWYIPRLVELLQETDTTDTGISGWIEYVIVRAAKYALDKEESDTTKLDQELMFLNKRIEETASNRDAGMSSTISDTRSMNGYWGSGGGFSGSSGGF